MDLLTTARVVISLAVVLAVIWFLSRRLRGSAAAQRARSRVQLLGKTGIGSKASVVVIETEGVRLVLGVTEHGVSVLHSADAPPADPAPTLAPSSLTTELLWPSAADGHNNSVVSGARHAAPHATPQRDRRAVFVGSIRSQFKALIQR